MTFPRQPRRSSTVVASVGGKGESAEVGKRGSKFESGCGSVCVCVCVCAAASDSVNIAPSLPPPPLFLLYSPSSTPPPPADHQCTVDGGRRWGEG